MTPQNNNVAEHLNHTLLVKIQVMLHDSGLLKFLWGEAAHHVVYLKNWTWTQTLDNTTPHEILTGEKPDLSDLCPWGSHVHVHDTSRSKLDGHSKIRCWVGFDLESNAHRIYWEERWLITVECSVRFNFKEEPTEGVLLKGEWDVEDDSNWSPSHLYPKASIKEIPDPDALSTPLNKAPESQPNPKSKKSMYKNHQVMYDGSRRVKE